MQSLKAIIISCCFGTSMVFGQSIVSHSDPSTPLSERLTWATQQGKEAGQSDGYWIGYSIKRMMYPNRWIGKNIRFKDGMMTGTFSGNIGRHHFAGKSLRELIYGIKIEEEVDESNVLYEEAQKTLTELKDPYGRQKKVERAVAILLHVRKGGAEPSDLFQLSYCSMELPFQFEGRPVFWLGLAGLNQSFETLKTLYRAQSSVKAQRDLVHAIGLHRGLSAAVGFVAPIARDENKEVKLRKTAAYALGDLGGDQAFDMLKAIIKSRTHNKVRKAAVYAVEDIENPDVVPLLEKTALYETEKEVAKAACYSLEDFRTEAAFKALVRILNEAVNRDVRKAAVYAISDNNPVKALAVLKKLVMSDAAFEDAVTTPEQALPDGEPTSPERRSLQPGPGDARDRSATRPKQRSR